MVHPTCLLSFLMTRAEHHGIQWGRGNCNGWKGLRGNWDGQATWSAGADSLDGISKGVPDGRQHLHWPRWAGN